MRIWEVMPAHAPSRIHCVVFLQYRNVMPACKHWYLKSCVKCCISLVELTLRRIALIVQIRRGSVTMPFGYHFILP